MAACMAILVCDELPTLQSVSKVKMGRGPLVRSLCASDHFCDALVGCSAIVVSDNLSPYLRVFVFIYSRCANTLGLGGLPQHLHS